MNTRNKEVPSSTDQVRGELERTLRLSNSLYRRVFKRLFDITLVLLMLPVVLPVFIGLMVAITVTSGSPFYFQDRVGKGDKVFKMWKFRSMVKNADLVLRDYLAKNPTARAEWDTYQKLKNDPRITPFGHLLRKTSMDELPQLWNVLIGDMSLVGPRPMMVDQKPLYPGKAYQKFRPGITGLWQVSDRNQSSFASRAGFDSTYDQIVSLSTDVKILSATVNVVIKCTGR